MFDALTDTERYRLAEKFYTSTYAIHEIQEVLGSTEIQNTIGTPPILHTYSEMENEIGSLVNDVYNSTQEAKDNSGNEES